MMKDNKIADLKRYNEEGDLVVDIDIKAGYFKRWNDEGILEGHTTYTEGDSIGSAKEYYATGKLKKTYDFKNKQYNGAVNEFLENGQKKSEMVFKNGKIEGYRKEYDENGKLLKSVLYKDGVEVKE